MKIFLIFVSILFITSVLAEGSAVASGPLCRGRICDDRPECPRTTCRCIYPSRLYCDVYYHCLNGKPYQYICSPGLYFNNDTLSCDYSYNVNCTLGTSPAATHTTSSMPPTEITNATIRSTTEEATTTEAPVTTIQEITTKTEISTTQKVSTTLVPSTHKEETTVTAVSTTEGKKATTILSTTEKETTPADISTGKEPTTTTRIRTTKEAKTPEMSTVSEDKLTTKNFRTTLEDTTTTKNATKATEATKPSNITNVPVTLTTTETFSTEKVFTNSSFTTKSVEKTTEKMVSASTVPPSLEFSCPSRFGLFPDSRSCFRFYHCSHWVPHHKWCPSGLHFNPTLRVCDWPYRAGCGKIQPSTIIDIQPTPGIPGEKNITHCDCDCCEIPVPGECNAYILCIDKTAFKLTCDKDLYFNPMTGTCDLQKNVHCETDVKCLKPFGRFSYPNSCSHFIECQNGLKTVKSCPEGLKFDNVTQMCSWTGSCGGDESQISTPEPVSNTTTCDCNCCLQPVGNDCRGFILCIEHIGFKGSCSSGLLFNPKTENCDFPENVQCEVSPDPSGYQCPEYEGLFPHTDDCKKFIHCAHGFPYIKDCPVNLHFNPTLKVCDWPYSAGCEGFPTVEPPPDDHKLPCDTCSSCFIPNENDCAAYLYCKNGTAYKMRCSDNLLFNPQTEVCDLASNVDCAIPPSGHCPKRDGLFPSPDCFKFIHCSNGIPYLKNCPDGLQFNSYSLVCDWPENVNCDEPPIKPTKPDDENPIILNRTCDCECCFYRDEIDCSKYLLCLDGFLHEGKCSDGLLFNYLSQNCDLADRVDCGDLTPICSSPNGFFPNPKDCSSYYRCSGGIPHLEQCPKGKHFSAKTKQCLDPCDADCDTSLDCTFSTPSIETTTGINPHCKAAYGLFPMPGSCTAFFSCLNYTSYISQCPEGLHFNAEELLCQEPCDARCDLTIDCKSTPSTETSILPSSTPSICIDEYGMYPVDGDCTSFYQCSNGRPYIVKCPKGLHFSVEQETCEHPCDAQCDRSIDCTSPTIQISTSSISFTSSTTISPNCLEPDGLFPVAGDCTSFYQCANGQSHLVRCPSGLHFSHQYEACEHPCEAKCDETIDCTSPTASSTSSTKHSTVSTTISPHCPQSDGLFPVEEDCTSFYQCSSGRAHLLRCPSGLHFSPEFQICDHPCEAKCDKTIDCSSPTTESISSSTTFIISTTISPNCLQPDGLFPVENDCTSFYQCSNGRAHKVQCPRGLHFSPEYQICEHPCEAKCDNTIDCSSPTTESISSSTSSTVSTTISPNCLQPDGLFPVEEDCTSFYQCSNGRAHLVRCPSGLHFSSEYKVCEHPCEAKCDERIDCTSPTTSNSIASTISTTMSPNCLQPNGLFPVPGDCTSFYQCANGHSHLVKCPSGLHFCLESQTCEHPCEAKCDTTIDCTSPTTSTSSTTISPNCPHANGFFPVKGNCESFYQCSNGQSYLLKCPNGLHFSFKHQLCERPCLAECDKSIDCTSSTTEESIYSTTASPHCPQPNGLYPVEKDCTSYYQCSNGKSHLMRCPIGLHFSPEYQACEHPCYAGCNKTIDCSSPTPEEVSSSTTEKISTLSPHCLEPNGLFPANDCFSFYLCSNGKEHRIQCPPGLHFSVAHEACEDPCVARCDPDIECTTSTKPTTQMYSTPSTTYKPVSPECIEPEGLFPNPEDCGSFFQCSNGRAHLVRCPTGLHFSKNDEICEIPCVAGCNISISCPTEIPDIEGNCTCESCFLPDPTDCSAYYFCSDRHLTKGYCPYGMLFDKISTQCENEDEVDCEATGDPAMCPEPFGIFPYPGDCKKFLYCENSVAHVRKCDPELEFDPENKVCSTPKGYCGSVTIDPHCKRPTGLFPYAGNCSLFYQCENGVSYLKACNSPLLFNPQKEVCDWPENVECGKVKSTTLPTSSTGSEQTNASTSTLEPISTSLPLSCHTVPGIICPCACRVPTYDDCSSFYQCQDDGTACKKYCPDGLYFNKREMVCDLPNNVECRDFFFTAMTMLKSSSRHQEFITE
ncbi:fibrillin-3-like isoform X2 [Stegodyphus dumicola]|uniref:fibrillin-3-like isoform X2 n=1 Tax=Stegodyphus dumicola TaxID=202533 RepID=UPI0015B228A5|nr:fibrillin-3-like isoform X2 [Stegodyphus dumicola]